MRRWALCFLLLMWIPCAMAEGCGYTVCDVFRETEDAQTLELAEAYDQIERFGDREWTRVIRNGKMGVIRRDGSVVLPCEWDWLRSVADRAFLVFQGEMIEFAFGVTPGQGLYGLYSLDGAELAPCRWDGVYQYAQTIMTVCEAGKWGVVGYDGQTVVPLEWDYIELQPGYINVRREEPLEGGGTRYWEGLLNDRGEVILEDEWSFEYSFSEGLCPVADAQGYFGMVDETGEIVIPCEWAFIDQLHDGRAIARKLDGSMGLINALGQEISWFGWDGIVDIYDDGFLRMCKSDEALDCDLYYLALPDGIVISEAQLSWIEKMADGYASVRGTDWTWGVMDASGRIVVPCQYAERPENLGEGRFRTADGTIIDVNCDFTLPTP